MKKHLIVLIIIFCSCSNAQKLEKSLLWKISGNGLAEPSYLFGTLHSICTIKMEPLLLHAIKGSEQFYLEMNPDDPDIQKEMDMNSDMKNGLTISSILNKEDFDILNNYFIENKGRSIYRHNTLKPEFINMMLTSKILECPTKSYEEEIIKIAKLQGKKIYGVEKMKDQLSLYDKIPYTVQLDGLMTNIKDDLENSRKRAKIMAEMYDEGDIEGLEHFIRNSDNKTYSNYADIILSDRNKAWIQKIEAAAKTTPTFFAFGVSHLAGKQGLIALLRQKGYKVEAVK